MTALIFLMILAGTPLLLATLGELVLQRSGVLNLGLEGVMLAAALAGSLAAQRSGNVWLGIAAGIVAALLTQAIFGFLVITLRSDAIVSGTALNFVVAGITATVYRAAGVLAPPSIPAFQLLGSRLDALAVLTWCVAPPLVGFFLWRTRAGLRIRAAGERPEALLEIRSSASRQRWLALAIEGVLAGIAGAYLSLALAPGFAENMTSGRGYIALALVIFGRWRPAGVVLGVAIFGITTLLQYSIQASGSGFPYQLLLALPFVATLLVLAGATGKLRAPRALGK